MVKFGEYFESMVALKPEWRNAYINYAALNKLLSTIKKNVKCVTKPGLQWSTGGAPVSPSASEQLLTITEFCRTADDTGDDGALHDSAGPHSGGADEEDTFVLRRGRSELASTPISCKPLHHESAQDERSSLLAMGGQSHGGRHHQSPPYAATPPFATSHSIYGQSFRGLPIDAAHEESMSRFGAESSGAGAAVAVDNTVPPLSPPLQPAAIPTHVVPHVSPPLAVDSPALQYQATPSSSTLYHSVLSPQSAAVPHMTPTGMVAAKEFENLLLAEVNKAVAFADKSFNAFADFIEENRSMWKHPKTPIPRTKDSMRYLNMEVQHLVQFLETNALAVKTATKKYLHSHPFYIRPEVSDHVLLPQFDAVLERTTLLQGVMASLWADIFMDGDINAARSSLMRVSASPTQSFRAGFFFAMIIACFLYWLHVRFELQPTADVMRDTDWMFPITRLCITLLFAGVCWGWVLWVFERRKINYLYVFEFSQTASTTWMQCLEYSLLMFFLCSLFSVLYVRASLHNNAVDCYKTASGFPFLAPYMLPTFLFIWIMTIVFPIRHVFRKTRNAFVGVFWRCMHLPFGDVRFVEFFVADWGTSLVIPCADLMYLVCFYTAEAEHAFTNAPRDVCLNVQTKFYFPVAMVPYFWRACQTFKMYRKTGVRVHLINHGKYQTFLTYFVVSWAQALWPSQGLSDLAWFLHFAAEVYAWVWDVLMDWGWVRGRARAMMFKKKWPYITAIVVDFILRMYFFSFTIWVQPVIGQNYAYLIQAMAEVFRRSMWSIFRIENENINNLESYRKIDFVPHVAPRDEFT